MTHYLVLACSPGLEPLRYELSWQEAFFMASQLKRTGWAVTVLKALWEDYNG
jgi:hypothetical protein